MSSTFGLGASTSSWTDIGNARSVLICGSNAAENHPIIMRHIQTAKHSGAQVLVIDPRRTPTALGADSFLQLRPGTDVAVLGAVINYILTQGLYDEEYLRQFTNAAFMVSQDYHFDEGLFSGYNSARRSYDMKSWAYQLDSERRPIVSDQLDTPGTVFRLLKDHFSRYDAYTAEAISGVPASAIIQASELIARNHPLTILYALGVTQHTTAVQTIRSYTILSLLLGSTGNPGGGIIALRGEPNIQGATDLGILSTHLPGYLHVPLDSELNMESYALRNGSITRKNLTALLKAWFGTKALHESQQAYSYLPRLSSDSPATYSSMLKAMKAGQFKAAVAAGINPVLSAPDNRLVQHALAALDFLLIIDLFATETAEFWQMPGCKPEEIDTEVILLPAAFLYEKSGTLTGNGRWIQWMPQILPPEGDAKADLEIIDLLFREVRHRYSGSTILKDRPILAAIWDYGQVIDPERVLQEINGFLESGDPVTSFAEFIVSPEGSASSGCWLYAGVYGSGNMAKRKNPDDASGLGLYSSWGYSWPANVRLLYNRASCDAAGQPKDPDRRAVWWNNKTLCWEGYDSPDVFSISEPPHAVTGRSAFCHTSEGVGRLFAAAYTDYHTNDLFPSRKSVVCLDGPLPEFYEPVESPVGNLLHPGISTNPLICTKEAPASKPSSFPYILTTYTPGAAPHPQSPTPVVEVSLQLAEILNLQSGDLAKIHSPRGTIQAQVAISPRLYPHTINGRTIHTVGMPYGSDIKVLAPLNSVNILTNSASDPTAGTPEYKCCMVDITKCSE